MDNKEIFRLIEENESNLRKIKSLMEAEEISQNLQLEDHNFKIDSTGWNQLVGKDGEGNKIIYLENPEKDVWEYVSGVPKELIGEQLFAFPATMRETKRSEKQVPTNPEWDILAKTKGDIPNLVFAGYRDTNGTFFYLSSGAFFWSSSISGSTAWYRYLYSSNSAVFRIAYNQAHGVSIRCLEN
ncbi:MAG: hypothetical protein KAJ58_01875 [Candidatus Pacebacteria bacterium]|nr:hypothetical protein [Candidatus Paceibacterota bacterium]